MVQVKLTSPSVISSPCHERGPAFPTPLAECEAVPGPRHPRGPARGSALVPSRRRISVHLSIRESAQEPLACVLHVVLGPGALWFSFIRSQGQSDHYSLSPLTHTYARTRAHTHTPPHTRSKCKFGATRGPSFAVLSRYE